MPKYKVTDEAGNKYEVNSFLPLDPDQVYARFTKGAQKKAIRETIADPFRKTGQEFNKQEFEALPSWRKVSKSVAQGGSEAVKGLGRSLGLTSEETGVEAADRKAMEDQMAKATPGGRAAQIYGNIGATAPLALATHSELSPLANMVLQGMAGGMMSSGQPEERLQNAAVGGAAGAALRGAEKVLSKPLRYVASGLGSKGAAGSLAAQQVKDAIPEVERAALATELRKAPAGTRPLAQTGNLDIAGLEAANRQAPATRVGWSKANEAENAAVADELANIVGAKSGLNQNITAAAGARDAATLPLQEDAIKAGTAALAPKRGPYTTTQRDVGQEILKAVGKPVSTDMAANKVLQQQLERLGQNPTMEQLANIRTTISRSGAASEKPVYETMKAIDKVMDDVSGGKWGAYLDSYSKASRPVSEAESAREIGRNFFDPVSGAAPANNPRISAEAMANALSAHGENAAPAVRAGIEDLAERTAKSNKWRTSAAAEPTGAEENIAQAGAQMAAGGMGAPGWISRFLGLAGGGDARAKAMAEILRSSPGMADILTGVPGFAQQALQQQGTQAVSQALRALSGG